MSLLDTPKLGFGLMRLPTMPGEPDRIDIEQTKTMVDMFMEAGLTYFDTAFVYGKDGASEKAAKEALVDRYPRDRFTLATKINAFLMAANEEECKRQFRISLERTGAGYFDFYLLHAIQTNNYKKYDEYGIWDYVKGLKEEGLVKNYGFSFHATPELLDKILTEHPDVDFIQLQINYADWENPSVTSRANYEVARKHGVPIVVMEPNSGKSADERAGDPESSRSGRIPSFVGDPLCGVSARDPDCTERNVQYRTDEGQPVLYEALRFQTSQQRGAGSDREGTGSACGDSVHPLHGL